MDINSENEKFKNLRNQKKNWIEKKTFTIFFWFFSKINWIRKIFIHKLRKFNWILNIKIRKFVWTLIYLIHQKAFIFRYKEYDVDFTVQLVAKDTCICARFHASVLRVRPCINAHAYTWECACVYIHHESEPMSVCIS